MSTSQKEENRIEQLTGERISQTERAMHGCKTFFPEYSQKDGEK